MTRGSIISKGILAAIIVFFSIFLFAFLEISKITPLDKNRPKNVNELEEMLSSEYRHFCFFTAFANGPKKPDIPWFEGSDERLNDQILAEYMELFPVADSQALLFFFDSDASIITAILLHENRGFLRWRVRRRAQFSEFCAARDQVAIVPEFEEDYYVIEFESNNGTN